ncbi:MAG: hypothetical protein EBY09_11165 [Verrucomicrobia bacterium]|nr:hypothetical protein [Verrucomicrobiota bacterium]NDE98973.1 hypothetical protein [Verrucomicrobiota bacterium]
MPHVPLFVSDKFKGKSFVDLQNDVGEKTDVASSNPAIVQRLLTLAEQARADLGDSLTQRKGSGVREPGRVAEGK